MTLQRRRRRLMESDEAPKDVQQFLTQLERVVRKHFPKGHFTSRARKSFGSNSIYITTATLPKGEQKNGIIENDPAYQTYWIHDAYTDEGMLPKVKVEMSQGGRLYAKGHNSPTKIGWRDKTGTPEQVLKHFDKYYGKLKALQDGMTEGRDVPALKVLRGNDEAQWDKAMKSHVRRLFGPGVTVKVSSTAKHVSITLNNIPGEGPRAADAARLLLGPDIYVDKTGDTWRIAAHYKRTELMSETRLVAEIREALESSSFEYRRPRFGRGR